MFQEGVTRWLIECFGHDVAQDRVERVHRFVEESVELAQACGCSRDEVLALVDYVFARPVGEIRQECGGVMVTLAALAYAHRFSMRHAADAELERCKTMIDVIRAKHAAKPKFGPLPESGPSLPEPSGDDRGSVWENGASHTS